MRNYVKTKTYYVVQTSIIFGWQDFSIHKSQFQAEVSLRDMLADTTCNWTDDGKRRWRIIRRSVTEHVIKEV